MNYKDISKIKDPYSYYDELKDINLNGVTIIKDGYEVKPMLNEIGFYVKEDAISIYDNKYRNISLELNGITAPYTYTIKNNDGENIVTNIKSSKNPLVFNQYFDEEEKQHKIENGTYLIFITDNKGINITQVLKIDNDTVVSKTVDTNPLG